jgi:hypothetical protein
MTRLNLNQRIEIGVKEEFRFVYSFYNRRILKSGPIKIGLCPIIQKDWEDSITKCRFKKGKSNFIN